MIGIPFDRCVILTTLDFAQISERLESAIYDPGYSSRSQAQGTPQHQHYFGQIQGFKFLATRPIGFKRFYLPAFLSPTIEGKIDSLHHGYEISLAVKLNNITVALMLAWLGGIFTSLSSILDNIFMGLKNDRYLTIIGITAIGYILAIAYFYFDAWRATRFFKTLFARRFAGKIADRVVADLPTPQGNRQQSGLDAGFELREPDNPRSGVTILRKNLPSFPDRSPYLHPGDRSPQ
jgi:hypothetical protein